MAPVDVYAQAHLFVLEKCAYNFNSKEVNFPIQCKVCSVKVVNLKIKSRCLCFVANQSETYLLKIVLNITTGQMTSSSSNAV